MKMAQMNDHSKCESPLRLEPPSSSWKSTREEWRIKARSLFPILKDKFYPPRGNKSSELAVDQLKHYNNVWLPHLIARNQNERSDKKIELQESDTPQRLGFQFSQGRKATILLIISLVQVAMNFNTSVYGSAVNPMSLELGGSTATGILGMMLFLIFYGIGSELWAPWSEECGRFGVMQWSLLCVNLSQLCGIFATRYWVVLLGRALGGLASAGGSVTMGMVADMWAPADQQIAVNFVVFASTAGSIVGPIVGGFIEEYRVGWRWIFGLQLAFNVVAQIVHFFLVPETRVPLRLDHVAWEARGNPMQSFVYGPSELNGRMSWSEIFSTWFRPFVMFVTEPTVLFLSCLSGFSDALIFLFMSSFAFVFNQWDFGPAEKGLAFLG